MPQIYLQNFRDRTLAGEARAVMLAAPVPDAVAQSVLAGYTRLGADMPVAVRSSATAEDLPFASFAGQQDTYLNVVGPDAVLHAVRQCWASLWTDRAVAYRSTNGIDHRTVRLAVVIQRMVDAQIAGVLFTANPVSGRRRQAVIDASPGLGEAVVSGAVNPDHFIVDTASGHILNRQLGDKRVVIRARHGGGTEHTADLCGADAACLTDDQIRAIAALGDRIEAHYGAPQDVEWAIDANAVLWLTQARPITTLFPLPSTAPPAGDDVRVYFCFSLAQGLQRPITPMGLACFRVLSSSVSNLIGFPVADPLAGASRYAEAGQRLFADLTGVLRSRVGADTDTARSRRDGGSLGGCPAPRVTGPAVLTHPAVVVAVRTPGALHRRALSPSVTVVRALVWPDAVVRGLEPRNNLQRWVVKRCLHWLHLTNKLFTARRRHHEYSASDVMRGTLGGCPAPRVTGPAVLTHPAVVVAVRTPGALHRRALSPSRRPSCERSVWPDAEAQRQRSSGSSRAHRRAAQPRGADTAARYRAFST